MEWVQLVVTVGAIQWRYSHEELNARDYRHPNLCTEILR